MRGFRLLGCKRVCCPITGSLFSFCINYYMIVPYLIGCAWVYDFWRAFRSNCSKLVFAATLLGVLYVPMTSETDRRSRGEVWDEVVARCAMIFVVFFILFMLMNSVKDFVFSHAFVVSASLQVFLPGVWRIQHIWHDIQLWFITSCRIPRCVVGERERREATASTSCRTGSAHSELA